MEKFYILVMFTGLQKYGEVLKILIISLTH
jgi:hypothetical protein